MSALRALPRWSSLAVLVTAVLARAEVVPFDSGRWVLGDAEIVEHLGRPALIGSADLPDAEFQDGIVEFDLAVDGSRGYPGVVFRATSPLESENVYCRPHVPGRPDALQYTPVFGGVAGWQLYNGPGFTAAVPIPAGEWIHVRLEVLGSRARVFFGDQTVPALVIDELQHAPRAGTIGIKSERSGAAFFADFQVTRTSDLDLGPAPDPAAPRRGIVRAWEVSQPLLATDVDLAAGLDPTLREHLAWRPVQAAPSGLVDLARHVPRHQDGQSDVVFARVVLHASRDELRRLSFGYSDLVWVFLDGRPLFLGNSAYQSRDATFSGIIGLADALYLPLHAGENELVFAVEESFGGWGLMAQDNADDLLAPGVTRRWQITGGNRLPESVLYDRDRDVLYVTQYFRGGDEGLARVSPQGEVRDAWWITGLLRPTGLALHGGSLWVVDRRHLVQIDPERGAIVARHPIAGAVFPNDVAFDAAGRAYVSDTRGDCIHRFADGAFVRWFAGPEVARPNGLCVDGDRLLYGNGGDGRLKAVGLDDPRVSVVARLGQGANVDGIRPDGRGGFLVSDFNGRLVRVAPDGALSEILDTTASGAFCADFEFVPEQGLLVVPGLYDNRLTAYRVSAPR